MLTVRNIYTKRGTFGLVAEVLNARSICVENVIKNMEKIKGIIYDLDGTIISTQKLHEDAWIFAAEKFGVILTNEMLFNQRGISDDAAALILLPEEKKDLINDFITAKKDFVDKNVSQSKIFPDAIESINKLIKNGYKVSICTSAKEGFVKKVLDNFPELKKYNIIWREMYKEEKPSPEAINLTLDKMGIKNSRVYYIGDALSDYKAGVAAKVKFIYFCPDIKNRDSRIPRAVLVISSHKQIFEWLN